MKKFVVYYRVSTDKQGDSGLGLEAQRRDCLVYLDNYEGGVTPLAEYTEVKSGKKMENREQLQAAIAHCKNEGAILLVAKLDRLSRDVHDITGLMKDRALDFRVATIPNADKIMLQLYAVMAEAERDFISARTKAALKVVKSKGVPLGTHNPVVAAAKDRRIEAARMEAEEMRDHLTTLKSLGLNNARICDHLNHMGIRTIRGNKWYPMTIKRVMERLKI
jgi:DNA invertase Pin-like site-specific DNA recombinase